VWEDAEGYRRAGALQTEALGTLRARGPGLPAGARLYLSGAPVYAAPGVPVLRHWDLAGAVALAARDGTASGVPLYPGTRLRCGGHAVRTARPGGPPTAPGSYRLAWLLDARTGRMAPLRGAAACRRERRSMRSGRWLAPATLTRLEP